MGLRPTQKTQRAGLNQSMRLQIRAMAGPANPEKSGSASTLVQPLHLGHIGLQLLNTLWT